MSTTKLEKRKQEKGFLPHVYRKDMTKGFLLLRKCVPDIEKLNRSDMLMETVKYIRELQNKVKELKKESPMESTPQTACETGMERDSEPKITLHHYLVPSTGTEQNCTDSTPREPLMPEISSYPMETDIWEPEMVDPTPVVATTPMDDHSTETVLSTSEEIPESVIVSPEEEEEELLRSPDEEEKELPEFNSVEDLRQWLGL
jgi:hypothetical protein